LPLPRSCSPPKRSGVRGGTCGQLARRGHRPVHHVERERKRQAISEILIVWHCGRRLYAESRLRTGGRPSASGSQLTGTGPGPNENPVRFPFSHEIPTAIPT
jgi:hypothetical protein